MPGKRMASSGYARYLEFFQPTVPYIETLLNETQPSGNGTAALPLVCRQAVH